jgi:hypothetical protein
MSDTLTEQSRALIRVLLDTQDKVTGIEQPPGPKTQALIRVARNEVGYATRREDVYYEKIKATWHE